MSTAARELEELRKAREAARLQAEEERKIEEEKQAQIAKKNAFLSRANAFQQKKGPTDEEVRQQVKKSSEKRNFGRKLNRMLKDAPDGSNPLAMELGLRGRAGNETRYGDADYCEEDGNEDDSAPRAPMIKPPPPPPKKLVGLGGPPPPPPPPPPPQAPATEEAESVEEPVAEEPAAPSPWYYVCENEVTPYYWNTETNETTLEAPPEYTGQIFSASIYAVPASTSSATECTEEYAAAEDHEQSQQQIYWLEHISAETGEVYYETTVDESSTTTHERPAGDVYIIQRDEETGIETHWLEQYDESSSYYYYTQCVTAEVVYERPEGTVMIVQTL